MAVHCVQEKLVKEGFTAYTGLGNVNHTRWSSLLTQVDTRYESGYDDWRRGTDLS